MRTSGSIFTVKNILILLSILSIIFIFCPMFSISAFGFDFDHYINFGIWDLVRGVSVTLFGETEDILDPLPLLIIYLILPIVILILIVRNNGNEKRSILPALILSGVDLACWLILMALINAMIHEKVGAFSRSIYSAWFYLNIIVLIAMVALEVLIFMGKIQLNLDLVSLTNSDRTRATLSQISENVSSMAGSVSEMVKNTASNIGNKKPQGEIIGYCMKCGNPLIYGTKFCTKCGTPIPQSLIDEAETKKAKEEAARKKAEEEARKQAEEEAKEKAVEEARRKAEEEASRKALEEEEARKLAEAGAAERAAEATKASEADDSAIIPQATADEVSDASGSGRMFCPQCGARIERNMKFCPSCGVKIGD